MRKIYTTLIFLAAGSISPASTLVTWSTTPGNTTGTGTLGSATVTWSITYLSNSDGIREAGNRNGPKAVSSFEGDVNRYGTFTDPSLQALVINAGAKDEEVLTNVGYTVTLTFDDGSGGDTFAFADSPFYLSDLEAGDILLEASNDGSSLNVSNWYVDTFQTSNTPGFSPSWDGTDTLNGPDTVNGDFWVSEFSPTEPFDSLSFSFTGIENKSARVDSVYFGLGNPIPEPSSIVFSFIGIGGCLIIRKR